MLFILGFVSGIGLSLIVLRQYLKAALSSTTDPYREALLDEMFAFKEAGKGFHKY